MTGRTDLVVLISGRGTNLQALLTAIDRGRVPARVCAVICDRPAAPGLEIARAAGIDSVMIDAARYTARESFDQDLHRALTACKPDWVILAGFMRVLGDDLVSAFTGRMINIHPSLLPRYRGLDTHARALAAGDREHGASVHFVTPALDAGPVLAQARMAVRADDTPRRLAERLLPLEHRLLPASVALLCRHSVQLRHETIHIDDQPLARPLELAGNELCPAGRTGPG